MRKSTCPAACPILLCVFMVLAVPLTIHSQPLAISGVTVPNDRIIVYLFIGHSNMAGRGAIVDTTANHQIWHFFIQDGFQSYTNYSWIPAKDPLYMDYNLTGSNVARPFLKRLANTYCGYNFGVLQNAAAGAKVSDYQINKYDEIIAAAKLVAPYVTFGGILCMLGVTNAEYDPVSAGFLSGLLGIIQRFRSDLHSDSLPLIMGQFEYTGKPDSTTHPYWRVVKALVDSVPKFIPHSYLVPVDSIEYLDAWHFDAIGNDTWASRAYAIAMNGNLVPAQLPVQIISPDSSVTVNIGDTLAINWRADYYVVSSVRFQWSLDQGKTWTYISGDILLPPRGQTGVFKWQVPNSIGGVPIVSNTGMLQIIDYDRKFHQTSKTIFTLKTAGVSGFHARISASRPSSLSIFKSMNLNRTSGLTLISRGIGYGVDGRKRTVPVVPAGRGL